MNPPARFNSLSEAHAAFGLPKPNHPLISLINGSETEIPVNQAPHAHVLNFYKISYRPSFGGKLRYGQNYYDFNEGGLLFASPNQIIGNNDEASNRGCSLYTLLIHPDFLWNYPLAKRIRQYGFFSYSANEALHLSEEEKVIIIAIFKMIEAELKSRIDDYSQDIIISQIELLLSYANRFYKRQFITRRAASGDLLLQLDDIIEAYFNKDLALHNGVPTVGYLAEQLHLSPGYLSDMLRALTGRNAQQHIHDKLIEKAMEQLSTTAMTVSEVAYALGFEHSQSFSKLFKTKTNLSPLEFRRSFN